MKLSIQYLQSAIGRGDPNLPELYQKTNETMITQIDQLSRIAGDFAQFAQISQAKLQPVNLKEVLGKWIRLYTSSPTCEIDLQYAGDSFMILGDEGHINRLFTNLVLNALQANTDTSKKTQIRIVCSLQDDRVVVSVSDDSGGIATEFTHLLFTPNFTTKTAGTGLGLAICKRIMEQAGGSIRFETEWGRGTTFFMEWPRLVG